MKNGWDKQKIIIRIVDFNQIISAITIKINDLYIPIKGKIGLKK
jgi:hypothetical protein